MMQPAGNWLVIGIAAAIGYLVQGVFFCARPPAVVAEVVPNFLQGLIPLLNRSTGTMPAVIGFLAFLNRNTGLGCSVLNSARSPYFIGVVPLFRFVDPLGAEIALPRLVELAAVVTLLGPPADTYAVRRDVEVFE